MRKLELLVIDQRHAVDALKQHLPLQFESRRLSKLLSPAMRRHAFSIVTMLLAGVSVHKGYFPVMAMLLSAALANWRRNVQASSTLVLTQQAVVADGISLRWEKIASVEAVAWRRQDGKPSGVTNLTVTRTDQTTVTVRLIGGSQPVFEAIEAHGLPIFHSRKPEERSS